MPAVPLTCRRCHQAVIANADSFEVFEQMHYTCFHYEFEHDGDPESSVEPVDVRLLASASRPATCEPTVLT